ncbi:MAG: DnaA/Hda family protein [Nitrososphaerales archaeon]
MQETIKNFMRSGKVFLVLYGPPGTYKTTTLKKLALYELKNRAPAPNPFYVYYTKFARLAKHLLEDQELHEIVLKTRLLLIDDLTFLSLREAFWLELFDILDERYEKKRKTIIATNHDPAEYLTGQVSMFTRIASRLCDENLSTLYETQKSGSFRNRGGTEW